MKMKSESDLMIDPNVNERKKLFVLEENGSKNFDASFTTDAAYLLWLTEARIVLVLRCLLDIWCWTIVFLYLTDIAECEKQ